MSNIFISFMWFTQGPLHPGCIVLTKQYKLLSYAFVIWNIKISIIQISLNRIIFHPILSCETECTIYMTITTLIFRSSISKLNLECLKLSYIIYILLKPSSKGFSIKTNMDPYCTHTKWICLTIYGRTWIKDLRLHSRQLPIMLLIFKKVWCNLNLVHLIHKTYT